ncbi:MAG: FxLD family lanthipeptide [Pseudonocardiaceae bacterium]
MSLTENTEMLDNPVAVNAGDFDLDVSIVESGDAAAALLGSTDNGCDTQKQGDC